MDIADQAHEVEELHREQALRAALMKKTIVVKMATAAAAFQITECVDCSEPIPRERLQVYPAATRCVECQGKHERKTCMR
jgi:phage/conjugal plasmid C-4 type zinc finger TraR family protein